MLKRSFTDTNLFQSDRKISLRKIKSNLHLHSSSSTWVDDLPWFSYMKFKMRHPNTSKKQRIIALKLFLDKTR